MSDFVKWVFYRYCYEHVSFLLQSVDMMNRINCMLDAELVLYTLDKSHFIIVCTLKTLIDLIGDILLRIFHLYSWKTVVCHFLFLWYLCIRIMLAPKNMEIDCLLQHLEEMVQNLYHFFHQIFNGMHLCLAVSFLEGFKLIFQFLAN